MKEERQRISISTGSWVRALMVITVAYAVFLVRELVVVVMTSIVIASAIEPLTRWAKRRSIPRLPMVILVYAFSAIVLAGLFYYLLLPLIGEMSAFIKTLTIYSDSVQNGGILSNMFRTQNLFEGFDTPIVIKELSADLNSFSNFISQGAFSSISTIFGGVLNFILIVVLSFYLVVQEDGISKFLKVITPLKYEPYIINLWRRSQVKIGLWMQGQLVACVSVMVLVYIGLLIAHVPNALLLAAVAGIFDLVPIVGPIVASVPAIFVGLVSGGPKLALLVAMIYLIVQQLENHIIFPLVQKKLVGVPPMISIIALVIGGTLAGFLGIIISVPVAAVAIEFISDFEERKIAQMSASERSS